MHVRQLGNTGLFVSELCLGTMTFGGEGMWKVMGDVGQEEADKIVEAALAKGINFFDTADVYSAGGSEKMLGRALKNLAVKRSDVVIATKVFGEMGQGPNDRGASRAHIMDGVQASLERLELDHIDLYQIHGNDLVTPVEETLRALDDLVSRGLVRYIGVSNWQAWKIMKALGVAEHRGWARFETLQAYYSVVGRDLERELAPMAADQRLGLMVWSPLAGGLLSGKFDPDSQSGGPEGARRTIADFPPVDRQRLSPVLRVLREIAARMDVSVARVSLAWVLSRPAVSSVIIGVRTLEQLNDNIAATDISISEGDLKALDEVSALPMEYPAWMMSVQGPGRFPHRARVGV